MSKGKDAQASAQAVRHSRPQLDKSWGKAVIACAATFFSSAVHSTSGIFYVAFMREFGINRETASWPTSVFQAMDNVSGLGSGVVCVALTVVLMMYFDKYRGVATGVRYAGYSLSSLLYPLLLTRLQQSFPFRQVVLLFAGMSLHLTPLVLALQEPPWERKNEQTMKPTGSKAKSHRNCQIDSDGQGRCPVGDASDMDRAVVGGAEDSRGRITIAGDLKEEERHFALWTCGGGWKLQKLTAVLRN
ncbi:hypothetical protein HPB50_002752 [Hyalomma asiaticum]|uniref:Uncharacterized protein n=1 Tax=Hyalomma asiaticum TaxID=266040 RepID=A0ACB7TG58_HYAAI|nr:hypothetical protein HPB50_002752 [Hyalomma asiaticum]